MGVLVARFRFPCRAFRGMHLRKRQEHQLVQDKARKTKKEALPMSFMSDQYSNAGTLHEMWRFGTIRVNADLPLLRGYRVTIHEAEGLLFCALAEDHLPCHPVLYQTETDPSRYAAARRHIDRRREGGMRRGKKKGREGVEISLV